VIPKNDFILRSVFRGALMIITNRQRPLRLIAAVESG
jgi:hypothetical protein